MSVIEKIAAAFTPPESEQDWSQARENARSYISRAPWLAIVLRHHIQIEDAFASVKAADTTHRRSSALWKLGILLTANALAEERAIYPALSANGQNRRAFLACAEQSCAKLHFGILERIEPMSQEFEIRLGHLECATKHHMYKEEGMWFLDLVDDAPGADHDLIAERYAAEFDRYWSGVSDVVVGIPHNVIAVSSAASRPSIQAHQPA